ncbi:hypothetical protein [Reichenbachiella sp. MSK19-1]|uniref:hypothetical protein n=1 Tax=Reichenbachiella sp. MSK19-1 TaxID=1897631 RepID=UPI000E6D42A7|nr:hypothetical protein [Reichenbachiella sp. MSK19-1]RJE71851.1 hypothetical protein BGP76_07120 [Reichenbachiella sp. MSK19-1]
MENDQSFEAYLISKKIDSSKFKLEEKSLYDALQSDFDQMNANSFTQQKLFLINPLRRKYLLDTTAAPSVAKPKTVFKPKIQK